jgi:hypothetical protein
MSLTFDQELTFLSFLKYEKKYLELAYESIVVDAFF